MEQRTKGTKKIRVKYDVVYLLIAVIFTIYQINVHLKNDITISNLIIEVMLFSTLHLTVYNYLKKCRVNKKSLAQAISKVLDQDL